MPEANVPEVSEGWIVAMRRAERFMATEGEEGERHIRRCDRTEAGEAEGRVRYDVVFGARKEIAVMRAPILSDEPDPRLRIFSEFGQLPRIDPIANDTGKQGSTSLLLKWTMDGRQPS